MSNLVPPSNIAQGGQILPSDILALYNFINSGTWNILAVGTLTASGLITANGGVTGTTGTFSGLITANGGIAINGSSSNYATDTGAVNALLVSIPGITAVAAGMEIMVDPANTGTGAATLNLNSLGILPIQYPNGTALNPGAIQAGVPVKFTLNSAKTAWIIGSNPTVPNATSTNDPVALGQSIVGGTLKNVTSSRALGTVYTNTGIRPIVVMVNVVCNSGIVLTSSIGGNIILETTNTGSGTANETHTFIVPVGDTYEVSGTTLVSWYEIS